MGDDGIDFGFAFTERDEPTSRARIERDLRRIVHAVREADPHLRALVLTGGFSRGEGTIRDGAPVNDYDLVAFRDRPGGGAKHHALHQRLSDEIGIEVDLLPVWSARVPRLAPKLFWLDLRLGGRVLWGDRAILDRMPDLRPDAVPPQEAARLLGNRAAGLLLALPGPGEPIDARQRDLQATKAALAAMDARLIARGEYAPTMRERLGLSKDEPDHPVFERAVRWKLSGAHEKMDDAWWDGCAGALLRAVDDLGARAHGDGLAEKGYHLLRARRVRGAPSQAVRLVAWDLLRASRFPDGPADPAAAAAILGRIAPGPPAPWPDLKKRFFEARARTLQ